MARMLAAWNPRSANSAIAALRIAARVSIERCCSALLRGRSRRAVFFAIWPSINMAPDRPPSEVSNWLFIRHVRWQERAQLARRLPGSFLQPESDRDRERVSRRLRQA